MRKARLEIQELGDGGYHLFTRGYLNGKEIRVLVDTGASKTVVAKKLIEEMDDLEKVTVEDNKTAGIGQDQVQADFYQTSSLVIGGGKVNDLIVGVISLDHVDQLYKDLGIEPFQVILGGDFLFATRAVIDYRKKEIRFSIPRDTN